MIVSKCKFRIDNSDGTYTEISCIMPHEIADKILCDTIGWKDKWETTTRTVEKFQEAEKQFAEQIKKKLKDKQFLNNGTNRE